MKRTVLISEDLPRGYTQTYTYEDPFLIWLLLFPFRLCNGVRRRPKGCRESLSTAIERLTREGKMFTEDEYRELMETPEGRRRLGRNE